MDFEILQTGGSGLDNVANTRETVITATGRKPVMPIANSEVKYEASYFNPCTGADIQLGPVTPDSKGEWRAPLPPEVHDWLLVLQAS